MASNAEEGFVSVDPATLQRSSQGTITGIIMLRLGDRWLPEPSWSDFPVILLTWWIEALTRPLSARSTSSRCQFMDGSFAFVVARGADDQWSIAPVINGQGRSPVRIDGGVFVRSVGRAAADVVTECERRGWESDVARLRSAVAGLRIYCAI